MCKLNEVVVVLGCMGDNSSQAQKKEVKNDNQNEAMFILKVEDELFSNLYTKSQLDELLKCEDRLVEELLSNGFDEDDSIEVLQVTKRFNVKREVKFSLEEDK